MNHNELTKEQLLQVAHRLSGWKYHELLSQDPHEYGHWLSNGSGQFINVNYKYGETLPQWSLKYIHPQTKHKVTFCAIGCSLKKSLTSIVSDVESRLLPQMGKLYQTLQQKTDEQTERENQRLHEQYMLDSLSKVLNLNEYYDHRYARAFRIEQENGVRTATIKKWGCKDTFTMTIDEVNPEKIVKIMNILNEPDPA